MYRTSLLFSRERALLAGFLLRFPLFQQRLRNEDVALSRDASAEGQSMLRL
jgi:hypothetical protein